jgi:heterodisulfide reductase subunit D
MEGSPLKKVQHITEFLADNLDKLDLKNGEGCTITYHDPCHLARHMDVVEQPRKILDILPGVESKEMRANREDTFCCGSGGGMRAYDKELADQTSAIRLREAKATGAEYLVTSCPFCERSFRSAQDADEEVRDIEVISLLDLICRFLK